MKKILQVFKLLLRLVFFWYTNNVSEDMQQDEKKSDAQDPINSGEN